MSACCEYFGFLSGSWFNCSECNISIRIEECIRCGMIYPEYDYHGCALANDDTFESEARIG